MWIMMTAGDMNMQGVQNHLSVLLIRFVLLLLTSKDEL